MIRPSPVTANPAEGEARARRGFPSAPPRRGSHDGISARATANEPAQTIRVAWQGGTALPEPGELPPHWELCRVAEPVSARPAFDLIVLDARAFENLDPLHDRYAGLGLPTVLVVDTVEQETAVLAWLRSGDDICRREVLARPLGPRLQRCLRPGGAAHGPPLDPLTGVADRRGFHERANTLLAAREAEEPRCLLLLDLDGFKRVNDRWGRGAGDRVLQAVGPLLRQCAPGAGLVARLGGDEFALLLRGTLDQGAALAEFLRDPLATHPFEGETAPIRLTASFGVVARCGPIPVETLLQETERCLYAAKEQGRNRVVTAAEFDALAEANGQDALIADFENRLRVLASRVTGALVSNARHLARQYRAEADHDGLTGLFNRRYLDRWLPREMGCTRPR